MGKKNIIAVAHVLVTRRREEAADFFTSPKSANDRGEPRSYIFWMTIFSGIGAVVAGLLHAAFWKPFSIIFGAIVSHESSVLL